MSVRIAVFTDNDFIKTNGVTTTLKALLRHAPPEVRPRIYTSADLGAAEAEYFAARSVGMGIPYYREMRMYLPRLGVFRDEMRRDGVAVVHVTTPGPVGLAGRYLARQAGLPLLGSFHTQLAEYTRLLSGSARLGSAMGRYLRWLYAPCEPTFVPSADTARRLVAAGWNEARLALWTRGVDVDRFSPDRRSEGLRQQWGADVRTPVVLYAGRLSREKGLALIEPVVERLQRQGAACHLVFVGDGPMGGALRARCPGATFTGALPHDEVATAMASADVFLFPSETDTAGNVVLEAQACGLPVLVADAGGPAENVLPGITGFVCRAGSVESFADRLHGLIADDGVRRAMGHAARMYAGVRSWSRALQPLFDTYMRIAASTAELPLGTRKAATIGRA
jgi:glycosyltransferase involved in cell wall biosynthesis